MHQLNCPQTLRQMTRAGQYRSFTSGQARGFIHCNLVIVPEAYADAFARFCHQNPKACPLVARSAVGSYQMPELGDIDLRFDIVNYQIFEYGKLVRQQADIQNLWRDDFVAFALGSAYSFEEAFYDAGLEIRRLSEGVLGPMYRTHIRCEPVPPFDAQLIVSMRPVLTKDVQSAIDVSAKFPKVNGAPLHVGDPLTLGIDDLSRPDFGEPLSIDNNEIPLFWACGITSHIALMSAKLPIAITHTPGYLLVTDIKNEAFASVTY